MSTAAADTRYDQAAIEADETLPMIHIWRDFAGTPEQLFRAHTDPELFARWVGPDGMGATIDRLGRHRRRHVPLRRRRRRRRPAVLPRQLPHRVPDRIVQTFTWEAMPDDVALETMTFEDLGDGRTRLHATSLCDSFEARDGWLRSGMEVGVNDGYAAIDRMLADGTL